MYNRYGTNSIIHLLDTMELERLMAKEPNDEVDELVWCKKCGQYEAVDRGMCGECNQLQDEWDLAGQENL